MFIIVLLMSHVSFHSFLKELPKEGPALAGNFFVKIKMLLKILLTVVSKGCFWNLKAYCCYSRVKLSISRSTINEK